MQRDGGFTLIECLLASAITSAIALACAMVFVVGLRASANGAAPADELRWASMLALVVPADVQSASSVAIDPPAGAACPGPGEGRTVLGVQTSSPDATSDLIEYRIAPSAGEAGAFDLVRVTCPAEPDGDAGDAGPDGDAGSSTRVVVEGLSDSDADAVRATYTDTDGLVTLSVPVPGSAGERVLTVSANPRSSTVESAP